MVNQEQTLLICIKCFCYFGQHMYVVFKYNNKCVCVVSKVCSQLVACPVPLAIGANIIDSPSHTEQWCLSRKGKQSEETKSVFLLCFFQCFTSVTAAEGNVEFVEYLCLCARQRNRWLTLLKKKKRFFWQIWFKSEPDFKYLLLNCWSNQNGKPPVDSSCVAVASFSHIPHLRQWFQFPLFIISKCVLLHCDNDLQRFKNKFRILSFTGIRQDDKSRFGHRADIQWDYRNILIAGNFAKLFIQR